jgi:hypothetical protein
VRAISPPSQIQPNNPQKASISRPIQSLAAPAINPSSKIALPPTNPHQKLPNQSEVREWFRSSRPKISKCPQLDEADPECLSKRDLSWPLPEGQSGPVDVQCKERGRCCLLKQGGPRGDRAPGLHGRMKADGGYEQGKLRDGVLMQSDHDLEVPGTTTSAKSSSSSSTLCYEAVALGGGGTKTSEIEVRKEVAKQGRSAPASSLSCPRPQGGAPIAQGRS